MPRPRRIIQRRQEFVEDLDGVKGIADDATTFSAVGGTWATHLWKTHAIFEMLAVRAYTAWESFLHDVLILTLATDTTELAAETGLSIKPTRVTADMAPSPRVAQERARDQNPRTPPL